VRVDADGAAVAQHELGTNHMVGGQTPDTVEWAVAARQRQARHADLNRVAAS
jgi:hypothetical protein